MPDVGGEDACGVGAVEDGGSNAGAGPGLSSATAPIGDRGGSDGGASTASSPTSTNSSGAGRSLAFTRSSVREARSAAGMVAASSAERTRSSKSAGPCPAPVEALTSALPLPAGGGAVNTLSRSSLTKPSLARPGSSRARLRLSPEGRAPGNVQANAPPSKSALGAEGEDSPCWVRERFDRRTDGMRTNCAGRAAANHAFRHSVLFFRVWIPALLFRRRPQRRDRDTARRGRRGVVPRAADDDRRSARRALARCRPSHLLCDATERNRRASARRSPARDVRTAFLCVRQVDRSRDRRRCDGLSNRQCAVR